MKLELSNISFEWLEFSYSSTILMNTVTVPKPQNNLLWEVKNGILGKEMRKMSNNTDLKLVSK